MATLWKVAYDVYYKARNHRDIFPEMDNSILASVMVSIMKFLMATIDCIFHPNRQNTQTSKLTRDIFDSIFDKVTNRLDHNSWAIIIIKLSSFLWNVINSLFLWQLLPLPLLYYLLYHQTSQRPAQY